MEPTSPSGIGTKSMQNNIGIWRSKIIWQPWSQSDSSGNLATYSYSSYSWVGEFFRASSWGQVIRPNLLSRLNNSFIIKSMLWHKIVHLVVWPRLWMFPKRYQINLQAQSALFLIIRCRYWFPLKYNLCSLSQKKSSEKTVVQTISFGLRPNH